MTFLEAGRKVLEFDNKRAHVLQRLFRLRVRGRGVQFIYVALELVNGSWRPRKEKPRGNDFVLGKSSQSFFLYLFLESGLLLLELGGPLLRLEEVLHAEKMREL